MDWPNLTDEDREQLRREYEEETMHTWAPWFKLIDRLKNIGIDLEVSSNIPWIYLHKVNGRRIKAESFLSKRQFTIAWFPIRKGKQINLTDRRKVFQTIRKNLSWWRGFIRRLSSRLVRATSS